MSQSKKTARACEAGRSREHRRETLRPRANGDVVTELTVRTLSTETADDGKLWPPHTHTHTHTHVENWQGLLSP